MTSSWASMQMHLESCASRYLMIPSLWVLQGSQQLHEISRNPLDHHRIWIAGGFSPPLWKIWVCQLGWWTSQYMEKCIKMFQTTNQSLKLWIQKQLSSSRTCLYFTWTGPYPKTYPQSGQTMLLHKVGPRDVSSFRIYNIYNNVCMYVYIYISINICIYIYIYQYMYIYIYINIYIYQYIYIYVYIYV